MEKNKKKKNGARLPIDFIIGTGGPNRLFGFELARNFTVITVVKNIVGKETRFAITS